MKLEYRQFDRTKDVREFCPLFWEYWLKVNGEDLGDEVEELVLGVPVKVTRIERALYGYLQSGFTIFLVTDCERIVGFIILRRVCDLVLEVRHFFLEEEYRDTGVGAKLLATLHDALPIKRIIFQTREAEPPSLFLRQTEGRRIKIGEINGLVTWEMDWGSNGREK